jgi:hypothetical protein
MNALTVADDQSEAVRVSRRLAGLGASRGAFQLLMNAAAQRQAAEVHDLRQWTPSGFIPLGRKAGKQSHPSNDNHGTASSSTA